MTLKTFLCLKRWRKIFTQAQLQSMEKTLITWEVVFWDSWNWNESQYEKMQLFWGLCFVNIQSLNLLSLLVFLRGREGFQGWFGVGCLFPPSSPAQFPVPSLIFLSSTSAPSHTQTSLNFPMAHQDNYLFYYEWFFLFVCLFAFLRDPLRQAFNLGINKEFTCCLFIDLLALKGLFI